MVDKIKYYLIILIFSNSFFSVFSQDSIVKVKYTSDFKFQDGIYLTFKEVKENKPSITEFEIIKDNTLGDAGRVILRFENTDSLGNARTSNMKDCYGYSYKGILYKYQGYPGYYYKLFLIGNMTHYMAIIKRVTPQSYMSDQPISEYGDITSDFIEKFIDFETGNEYFFKYKVFCEFLKAKDVDLYNVYNKTRDKKQLMHNFLLKYNEKHPLYFPVTVNKEE